MRCVVSGWSTLVSVHVDIAPRPAMLDSQSRSHRFRRGFNPKWTVGSRILFVVVLLLLQDRGGCNFSGFNPDDSTMAVVNLTYMDPYTGRYHTEKSEIGKFGTGLVGVVNGIVVHVRNRHNYANGSNNGCEYPFENKLPSEPWIALIKRGGCHFQTKISHSSRSNASGVIVYNDNDDPALKKMDYQVRDMVAIFITLDKGEEIASLVENGTRVQMYITVGTYHPPRPNINRTSVLFVSISFIVLMIISLAWLVFYYVQRFRYIHAKDQLARRLCSAAKKALAKIPVKNIKAGDKEAEGEYECCAVCIEPYKPSDVVRTLPCKHVFHKTCVDPWLLEHRTCPMCKMDILKFYGLVYTGSQESILQIDVEDAAVSSSGDRDSDVYPPSSSLQLPTPQDSLSDVVHPISTAATVADCVETYVEPDSPTSAHLGEKASVTTSNVVSLCGSQESVEANLPSSRNKTEGTEVSSSVPQSSTIISSKNQKQT